MIGSFHRRAWVLLVSAAVGIGAWKLLPGTAVNRMAFITVARSFTDPPRQLAGQGTPESPWKLRAFKADLVPDSAQAPVLVALGNDRNGVFQSSPLAAVDLAVIFSNLKRLGVKKVASAALLAWDAPDPIGLLALEKSLVGFESLVMAAPLSRGAVAAVMPPAFRRASLALAAVHGNTSALPVVNRVPIPDLILGGETATAGFSLLESESPTLLSPLLARWEDRVILAFPLLTVLQRLNLPPTGVEVRLGEFLKLGPEGPLVAIDDYGRFAVPLKPMAAAAVISVEALIDGGDELLPKPVPGPVILVDERSAAEPATREFSQNLPAEVAAIAAGDGFAEAHEYPRLELKWEIGILAAVVIVLTVISGMAEIVWYFGILGLVWGSLAAQWFYLSRASCWLPGLPVLAVIFTALVVQWIARKTRPLALSPPNVVITRDGPT